MTTAGILADNYKLDKFKEQLDKKGFTYEIVPLTKNASTIKVSFHKSRIQELAQIINMVQHLFKASSQN